MLALAAGTNTFAAALPFSCMPVLFKEISEDLGLNLVQIGTVWGMASLAGVFVVLIGGLLGDRFGVKLTVGLACVLLGVTGALRGLSSSFSILAMTMFASGLMRWIMPVNVLKMVSLWFSDRNLGLANGVVSLGMGIGLLLGPMISATVLSPALGGWRSVLFLYGGGSTFIGILWFLFGEEPRHTHPVEDHTPQVPILQALSKLVRVKQLRYLGFTLMCRFACIIGFIGYLPLYLRGRGWESTASDGALTTFYAASILVVIPLSLLSDRLGSRKGILFPALLLTAVGMGLLPIFDGITVWILVILVGITLDSFMALLLTTVQEIKSIEPRYSGAALGLIFTISHLGAFVSPPIGNSLAGIDSGLPFIFWAGLSVVALVPLMFAKETGR